MKKTLIVLVGALLAVGLWGCGEKSNEEKARDQIEQTKQDVSRALDKASSDLKK